MVYVNKSLPVRGAWIEMINSPAVRSHDPSLPVRGAWIEIAAMSKAAKSGDRRYP